MTSPRLPDAFVHLMSDTQRDWWVMIAGIVGFALIGCLLAVFSQPPPEQRTLRGTFRYLFPPHLFRSPHSRVDLACFILLETLFLPLLALLVFLTVGPDVQGTLVRHFGARPEILHSPWTILPSQFMISFIAGEFAVYCSHRFLHTNQIMWSFHRPHHSAEVLTFLTSRRGHPLEPVVHQIFASGIGAIATGIFLYATGTTLHPALPQALLMLSIWESIVGKFNHSHLNLSFGPLNYVLLASRMHHVHHSAELRHRDKNFGGVLSLFDWIFGTIYIPAKEEQFRLGLSEGELGSNNPHNRALDIFLEPFSYAWRVIRNKGRSQLRQLEDSSVVVGTVERS